MTNRLLTTAVVVSAVLMSAGTMEAHAQELNAKVTINHSQIQGTDASVFEEIEQNLTQFINEPVCSFKRTSEFSATSTLQ